MSRALPEGVLWVSRTGSTWDFAGNTNSGPHLRVEMLVDDLDIVALERLGQHHPRGRSIWEEMGNEKAEM